MEHAIAEELAAPDAGRSEQPVMEAPFLLRLPAELRVQIYEWALTRPLRLPYRQPSAQHIPQPPQAGKDQPAAKSNALALLEVCRQIYQETRLLPFQLSKIILPKMPSSLLIYGGRRDYLRVYSRALEALQYWQQKQIRHLEVHTNMEDLAKLKSNDFFHGVRQWVRTAGRGQNEKTLDALRRQRISTYARDSVADPEEIGQWIARRLVMLTSLETFIIDATDIALSKDFGPQAG
ncbi:hypothetical protein MMC30_002324 [Trapelia coarctata]|nr:hypothetical protein [Trapelia coarctata]